MRALKSFFITRKQPDISCSLAMFEISEEKKKKKEVCNYTVFYHYLINYLYWNFHVCV